MVGRAKDLLTPKVAKETLWIQSHGGLEDDLFFFNWVTFGFQPLILRWFPYQRYSDAPAPRLSELCLGTQGEPNKTKITPLHMEKQESMKCNLFICSNIFDKYSKLRNKNTQKCSNYTRNHANICRSSIQKFGRQKCRASNPRIQHDKSFCGNNPVATAPLCSNFHRCGACAFIPRHRTSVPEVPEFQMMGGGYWNSTKRQNFKPLIVPF